jgi:hypothetical protein
MQRQPSSRNQHTSSFNKIKESPTSFKTSHSDNLFAADYSSVNVDLDSIFPEYPSERRCILAEGVLEKMCGWNHVWKCRYFVLEKCGRLSYFKSQSDRLFPERAKRVVPINVETSLIVSQNRQRTKTTIEIKGAKDTADDTRTLTIGFDSPQDFERWQIALGHAQQNVLFVSVPRT